MVSNAGETSFCNPHDSAHDDDDDDSEVDLSVKGVSTSKHTESHSGSDDQRGKGDEQANKAKEKTLKMLVVSPHRKRNQIR